MNNSKQTDHLKKNQNKTDQSDDKGTMDGLRADMDHPIVGGNDDDGGTSQVP